MEEKIVARLTEEEKIKFFHVYNCGDLGGLEYLESVIKENKWLQNYDELERLINDTIALNNMEITCEDEDYEAYQRNSTLIGDLYSFMKRELFDAVGITDEDFKKYGGA